MDLNYQHTPTSRLLNYILRDASTPLSFAELIALSGASPAHVMATARAMTSAGVITRMPGKTSRYTVVR